MNKFNYNTSFAVNDLKNYTLADYPFLREIDIADWIKPYVFENDYERMVREFECEKKRWVYMFNKTISENERFMYQLIGK